MASEWMRISRDAAEQREVIVEEVETLIRLGVAGLHPRLIMERFDANLGSRRRPSFVMIEKTFAEMVDAGFLVLMPRVFRHDRRVYCRPDGAHSFVEMADAGT